MATWHVNNTTGSRNAWVVGETQLLQLTPRSQGAHDQAAPRVWKIAVQTSDPAGGVWRIRVGNVAFDVVPSGTGIDLIDVPGVSIAVSWVATVAAVSGALNATIAPLFSLPGEWEP